MAEIVSKKGRDRPNWSEGFRRVAILLWAGGCVALVVYGVGWTDLYKPFENVCMTYDAHKYDECLRPKNTEDWLSEDPDARVGRMARVDESRVLPRWRTPEYRAVVGLLLGGLVAWGGALWGTFYAIKWIARGFTRGGGRG